MGDTNHQFLEKTDHEKIFFPEELYSSWIGNSLVLMTSSLLFYHMTRLSSLEMDARVAGMFAVILILISVTYAITSIIPYYQRTGYFIRDKVNQELFPEQVKNEKHNRILYMVLGSVLCLIEFGIAIVIIKGSFFMKNKNILPSKIIE